MAGKFVAHLSFFHELLFNSAVVVPLELLPDNLDISLDWSETSPHALLSLHSDVLDVLFIELRIAKVELWPGSLASGADLFGMHWCR